MTQDNPQVDQEWIPSISYDGIGLRVVGVPGRWSLVASEGDYQDAVARSDGTYWPDEWLDFLKCSWTGWPELRATISVLDLDREIGVLS